MYGLCFTDMAGRVSSNCGRASSIDYQRDGAMSLPIPYSLTCRLEQIFSIAFNKLIVEY
jgi:hypothetical protein